MNENKLTIGLTGGIGSGKSAAEAFFRELGIAVVDADQSARAVVEKGMPALDKIKQHFGAEVIQSDGNLDRTRLRQMVFQHDADREWLEALLHPLIRDHVFESIRDASSSYAIYSAPLLIESGSNSLVDRILVVDVPEEIQRKRAAARDGATEESIGAIMASQCSRSERLDKADDVLDNSGSLEELEQQVLALHKKYLELAKNIETSS